MTSHLTICLLRRMNTCPSIFTDSYTDRDTKIHNIVTRSPTCPTDLCTDGCVVLNKLKLFDIYLELEEECYKWAQTPTWKYITFDRSLANMIQTTNKIKLTSRPVPF